MSQLLQRIGYGLAGAAATRVARRMTSRALRDREGIPKLPQTVTRLTGLRMVVALALATGVVLALVDLLKEQRKMPGR